MQLSQDKNRGDTWRNVCTNGGTWVSKVLVVETGRGGSVKQRETSVKLA